MGRPALLLDPLPEGLHGKGEEVFLVDPPPPAYGIEIEVWEGEWRPWKQYVHRRSSDRNLFFVPDVFPGDLGGRVRMWGIYDGYEAKAKTPWRYFEFRVTY